MPRGVFKKLGEISDKNIAIPIPIGTANKRASIVVIIVPYRGAAAPNISFTGFQSSVSIKFKTQNSLIANQLSLDKIKKTEIIKIKINIAEKNEIRPNDISVKGILKNFFIFLYLKIAILKLYIIRL